MRTSVIRHRLLPATVALAVAIAVVMMLVPGADWAKAQDGASVGIANFAFSPNSVTITAGSTVTWTNNDSVAHTATGDGGSFDTGNIAPGASASITFDTPGTYAYICSIHPNMTGTVVVTAAGDGGDDVTGLPDTGAGVTNTGQFGGTEAALAALGSLALAMAGLVLRRRAA